MERAPERFGEYIKKKRMASIPRYTLKKMAQELNMNLTHLSDIENGRKNAFSADKIEKFCEILNLSNEEKERMYDLAARDLDIIPEDISDTIMYTEQGDMARIALRKVNQGKGNVEMWKELIRKMEEEN